MRGSSVAAFDLDFGDTPVSLTQSVSPNTCGFNGSPPLPIEEDRPETGGSSPTDMTGC